MIILDTHAWIWWLHPELEPGLPSVLRQWLENTSESLGVSVFSCLEIAQLVKKQRLLLPMTLPAWFDKALAGSSIDVVPVTPYLMWKSVQLPNIHADPADRVIIATAQEWGSCLVTRDENIQKYPNLLTIWKNVSTL